MTSQVKRMPQWLIAIGVSIAFAVLFGIGVVASSLIFSPERITENPLGFWLSVVLKTATQLISFNLAYFIYIVSKKTDIGSNLMQAFNSYAKFVKYVYAKCMQASVRARVKTVNRSRMIETSDTILETITESLHYIDLFISDTDGKSHPVDIKALVKEKTEKYELTKRQARVLRKHIVNIINGRVRFEKVDYNEVMIGADKVKNGYVSMSVSEGGMILKKNAVMIVMAFGMAVITSIFIMGTINGNILYEMLSSLLTIIMSVLSAIIYGVMVVSKMIRAYTARRDFFNEFIELPADIPAVSPAVSPAPDPTHA